MGLQNRPADARAFSLPNSRKGPGIEVGAYYNIRIILWQQTVSF